MSIENYLNTQEEILYQWDLREKEEQTSKNILGITNKRVFHFKTYKRERTYRDVPLEKIEYLENQWLGRNMVKLIAGIILTIIGVIFLLIGLAVLIMLIIGLVFLIIGIRLIIEGLKQYGTLMINQERWKFKMFKTEDLTKIEAFISIVYFVLQ